MKKAGVGIRIEAMKWTWKLVVLVVMGPVGCVSMREGAEGVYEKQIGAVVTVVGYDPDKAMPQVSSGFFLAADRVVTARHALAGAERAEVRTSGGETLAVEGILAENQTMDVVMLQVEGGGVVWRRTARLSEGEPRIGQKLVAIGAPLGLEHTVSEGLISGIWQVPEAGQTLQHTVAVSPGSSGGPLFDMRGRVVAIQTGTITTGGDRNITAGQSLNFAVPARYIGELVAGELKGLAEGRKEVGAEWSPVVTRNVDRLGLRPFTRGDFAGARAYFEKRTEQKPEEADGWFRLGLCREHTQDLEGAMKAYRRCLELSPGHAVAGNNLGQVLLRRRQEREAVAAFRGALESKPDHLEALTGLAVACVNLKEYGEAIKAGEKAVRINDKQRVAYFALGRAYLGAGDRERAMKQLAALEKLDEKLASQLRGLMERGAETRPAGATTQSGDSGM